MPAMSEKQQRFMGAELSRKREGTHTRTGMSEDQLEDFASKSEDTADATLIRKAIQEVFDGYDVDMEKQWWRTLGQAVKPALTSRAAKDAVKKIPGVKGWLQGWRGQGPRIAPVETVGGQARPIGSSAADKAKQIAWDKRKELRYGDRLGQWRTAGGQFAGDAGPSRVSTLGRQSREAFQTAAATPGKVATGLKRTTLKTPEGRRTALKYGGRTAAVGALAGGVTAGIASLNPGSQSEGEGWNDPSGQELSELGPIGSKQESMTRIQQPEQPGTDVEKPKGKRGWMGRKEGGPMINQMSQSYTPSMQRMIKEVIENATSPQPAMSMPTTSAEMPAAVFNDSMLEIMGKNLPPVRMKVDDQDTDVQKVTEGVMEKLEKQGEMQTDQAWQSAQQIGQDVINSAMNNPHMIPGFGPAKKLWDKMQGQLPASAMDTLEFDANDMPLDPKTKLAMHPEQLKSFYQTVMGSEYGSLRSGGIEALNQANRDAELEAQGGETTS